MPLRYSNGLQGRTVSNLLKSGALVDTVGLIISVLRGTEGNLLIFNRNSFDFLYFQIML